VLNNNIYIVFQFVPKQSYKTFARACPWLGSIERNKDPSFQPFSSLYDLIWFKFRLDSVCVRCNQIIKKKQIQLNPQNLFELYYESQPLSMK